MTNFFANQPSRLLAYLQLMRLPNVFTAMADIAMGFLLTHESVEPVGLFALLILSSSCFYLGGMVSNDLADQKVDQVERPNRPLPSGRVSKLVAERLCAGLLIGGLLFASAAGLLGKEPNRTYVVSMLLLVLILLYNGLAKRTVWGPIVMGGCRMLNVLLGMSVGDQWTTANWTIASGLGVYVAGVTWFARGEATISKRLQLASALITMLGGMAILWSYPRLMPQNVLLPMQQAQPQNWTLLWTMLALIIGWRAFRAILQPTPAYVQAAVKTGILSIIILDAVVVFAVHGPTASVAILLLLIPTIVLGWWVYST